VRVLVIDDDPSMRDLYRLLLDEDGPFTVVASAENGRDGQRLAAELQPDLILSDIHMPVLDGLAATPGYRSAAPHAVIVLTSSAPPQRAQADAITAGADLYLDKGGWGVDAYIAELVEAVESAQRRRCGSDGANSPGPNGRPGRDNSGIG